MQGIPLDTALMILSAMVTPAVLISACGSLTISTSQRLGRSIERTRDLLTRLQHAAKADVTDGLGEEVNMLTEQLERSARRTRLLHRALTMLYVALSMFIACSVVLGTVAWLDRGLLWLPLLLALVGAVALLYCGGLLVAETQVARGAIVHEIDFMLERAAKLAPRLRPKTEAIQEAMQPQTTPQ